MPSLRPHFLEMQTPQKTYRGAQTKPSRLRGLNWRKPLFYVLLPVFFIMAFLGFPLPVAPPPAIKPAQERAALEEKKGD
jgi:hypothetical protein